MSNQKKQRNTVNKQTQEFPKEAIESMEKLLAIESALNNLKQNKDWQFLIENHFLKDEVVRLTHLISSLEFHDSEVSESNSKEAVVLRDTLGRFNNLLLSIPAQANQARKILAKAKLIKQG